MSPLAPPLNNPTLFSVFSLILFGSPHQLTLEEAKKKKGKKKNLPQSEHGK